MVGKVVDPFAGNPGDGGAFANGRVSMVVQGNWYVDTIQRYKPDLNYGIAPIPVAEGVKGPVTWSGGWSVVIPKGAKHPQEAFEFMKYFVTKGAETWLQAYPNNMPVVRALVEVTLACFDGLNLVVDGQRLSLPHVAQALPEIGATAARLVLDQMAGQRQPRRIVIPTRLVTGPQPTPEEA